MCRETQSRGIGTPYCTQLCFWWGVRVGAVRARAWETSCERITDLPAIRDGPDFDIASEEMVVPGE